jgi:kynureninase
MITSKALSALDREDALAPFRDQFDLPEGVIYLDGNGWIRCRVGPSPG